MIKRTCFTIMIFIIISLSPIIAYANGGISYLGEICFVLENGSFAPPSIYRLGVLSYGKEHFELNGDLGSGAAGIDDKGMIIISLTSTGAALNFPQPGSATSSSSIHMVVDPFTLTGNYRVMGFSWKNLWDTAETPVPFTDQGSVHIYACN